MVPPGKLFWDLGIQQNENSISQYCRDYSYNVVISLASLNFYQKLFIFSSCRHQFGGFCGILRCLTCGEVFWHLAILQNEITISQYFILSYSNTLQFVSDSFDFFERVLIFFKCVDDFH